MAVNQKAVKVLNKVLEAGFADEKAIAAMTMDDILSMQGITAATIVRISPFGDRCICWPLKLMKKIPIKATMKPTTKLILKGSSLKHR